MNICNESKPHWVCLRCPACQQRLCSCSAWLSLTVECDLPCVHIIYITSMPIKAREKCLHIPVCSTACYGTSLMPLQHGYDCGCGQIVSCASSSTQLKSTHRSKSTSNPAYSSPHKVLAMPLPGERGTYWNLCNLVGFGMVCNLI